MARTLKEAQEGLRKVKKAYEDAKSDPSKKKFLPKFEQKVKAIEEEVKRLESEESKKKEAKSEPKEKPKRRVARKRATSPKKESEAEKGDVRSATLSQKSFWKGTPFEDKSITVFLRKKENDTYATFSDNYEGKNAKIIDESKVVKLSPTERAFYALGMATIEESDGSVKTLTAEDKIVKEYVDKAVKGLSKESKSEIEVPEKEISEKDCEDEINAYIKRQKAREKAKATRESNKRKASAKKSASKTVSSDLSGRSVTYIKSVIKYQKKEGDVNIKEVEHFAKLLRDALKYAKEKFSGFKSQKDITAFDKEVKKLVEELKKSNKK